MCIVQFIFLFKIMDEKNLSKEFEEMDAFEFHSFLRKLNRSTQNKLLVIIRTGDISKAKRLKAIKENPAFYDKLKFQFEIEATVQEYKTELNVFASGIKWIEKK